MQLNFDSNIGVPVILGLINLGVVVGGFIYQNGKQDARTEAATKRQDERSEVIEKRLAEVERTAKEVHEEQIRGKSVSDDVGELKTGFNKLAEGITTLAVIQAQTNGLDKEMVRTRERLHDLEQDVRGLLGWRQGVTEELTHWKSENR